MAALLILRDRVIRPLMAAASSTPLEARPTTSSVLDLHYRAVHHEMLNLFTHLGIAA